VFRENQLSVRKHVELAFAARLDGRVERKTFLDLGRETRSLGFVVSHHAVFDEDLHRFSLSSCLLAGCFAAMAARPQPITGRLLDSLRG
jgi:hypothetical protein